MYANCINTTSVEKLFSAMGIFHKRKRLASSQEDGLFQVSNDNDDQDPERDIESSCEWRNLINEWIEMVDEDEQINQTNEENSENLEPLIERVMNLDQILRNNTHLLQKC
ncbi:uncharacterized protein OCT59_013379 [Rhizophagus irregularis]|uniref:Uncharacterized protein n=1 Tax=Rhizophagus irregularis TaxID=588596 RepID=A0A915ZHA6_9GLOM|nr:hypothetical protein OCT59_013379 [Rhizophagus irregularis]CAB4466575.1 unnamed protein product [Rhizophagus irregularis]CAB5374782.1 unnamed protein product [Rhizophagus irregularis]